MLLHKLRFNFLIFFVDLSSEKRFFESFWFSNVYFLFCFVFWCSRVYWKHPFLFDLFQISNFQHGIQVKTLLSFKRLGQKKKLLLFLEMRLMKKIFTWPAANYFFLINLTEFYWLDGCHYGFKIQSLTWTNHCRSRNLQPANFF